MPPLTDFAVNRSHDASLTSTSPLTDPSSSPRALTPFNTTLPLTLPALTSPSTEMPDTDTLPDVLFADSSFGVSVAATAPLTLVARTDPFTPEIFTLPEIDDTSRPADDGTVTVKSTDA